MFGHFTTFNEVGDQQPETSLKKTPLDEFSSVYVRETLTLNRFTLFLL